MTKFPRNGNVPHSAVSSANVAVYVPTDNGKSAVESVYKMGPKTLSQDVLLAIFVISSLTLTNNYLSGV